MKTLTTVDKLEVGDVVEIETDGSAYIVATIEDRLILDDDIEVGGDYCLVDGRWHVVDRTVYLENDSNTRLIDSGFVYRLGSLPQVTFAQNGNGTIHAMLSSKPICGHNFTSNWINVRNEPTCESCKRLLS